MARPCNVFGFAAMVLSLVSAARSETTLFDGVLGSLPSDQGWVYLADGGSLLSPPASASQSLTTIGARLESSTTTDRAGYFSAVPLFAPHPSVGVLDRNPGYTVRFTAQLLSESHAGSDNNADSIDDRAGFSVIALSDDLVGIELGFWPDEVWAQDYDTNLFVHDEGALFDTTTAFTVYDLTVRGDSYALAANGTPLLSGPLRDYSGSGIFPYSSANSFLFFGDDTTSAAGSVELTQISISMVPEPATWLLTGWALFGLRIGRRRVGAT